MGWEKTIGKWAFLVGLIGATGLGVLAGLGVFQTAGWYLTLLVLVGVVIGLLNITAKESVPLMVAALVIGAGAGVLGQLPSVGMFVGALMTSIAAVILPAAIIVAVKTIYKSSS